MGLYDKSHCLFSMSSMSYLMLYLFSFSLFFSCLTVTSAAPDNSSEIAGPGEDSSAEEGEQYLPVIECKPNVTIEDVFRENRIIDDLPLDFSEHYLALIEMEYADNLTVHCGNELTPNQTVAQPTLFNYPGGWYEHYSVIMIDPDASIEKRPVLHWMIVNVPGPNITAGESSCPYRGPRPPLDSGLHRYISLIYLQSDSGPIKSVDYSNNRYNFNLTSWVIENNLQGPVFGNFFTAQNKSPVKLP